MSEMVERAAKAMYAALGGSEPEAQKWDDLRTKYKDGFRDQARVTIEAMREPTEKMIKAADVSMQNDFYPPDMTWQIMIDEALK